ncbi:hypothetical protein [Bythopirellula polymerisocia]|uniref:Uncharacterized protein n=1 Tax=Bythopirellula polymerisocia TaxID=2528003 RepID=A0A5C6CU37_9BACT|nr:hypothetical protein [Bythopirellula polymerisocia]TWU28473.1 hypothetical protein Pla144_17630 [Bythopirellula polymerisocia]
MNTSSLSEFETVNRSVARWGSVAAAILFAVGFLTDPRLSANLVIAQWMQILLILLVFVGYLLAWKNRFELSGSILALFAMAGYWIWCRMCVNQLPDPIVFMLAAPALFHVLAVLFHRVLRWRKAS